MGRGWLPFVLLALVTAAAAVQPLDRVDRDVLYLPRDGVALNARTGAVLWRFPRLDGQTYTDGHGLLMVSWVAVIDRRMNLRYTRVCRLRARDGKQLWCRDTPRLQQWTVDTGGKRWYMHTPGRLEVLATDDGQPDSGFRLHNDGNLSLLPLPTHGALLLDRGRAQARALVYHPGAVALSAEKLPSSVYAFRGDGRGLILYARKKGEFFLADPLKALLRHVTPALGAHPFPLASLDQHGFVFTDWQGENPVVRGGTYDGSVWQAPRSAPESDSKLAVGATTALMLDLRVNGGGTQVQAWDLRTGKPRYTLRLDRQYPLLACRGNDLVLQSDGDVRLVDAATGAARWAVPRPEGALAAIAGSTIVFWEDNGALVGLSRRDGHLVWRLNFRVAGLG